MWCFIHVFTWVSKSIKIGVPHNKDDLYSWTKNTSYKCLNVYNIQLHRQNELRKFFIIQCAKLWGYGVFKGIYHVLTFCQDFSTISLNQNCVLKLCGRATISGESSPVVRPCCALNASHCQNWLYNKEDIDLQIDNNSKFSASTSWWFFC